MAAEPSQHEALSLDPVDQEKIGPDVALPIPTPLSPESMIAIFAGGTLPLASMRIISSTSLMP